MKVRKNYVLYINNMLGTSIFGNEKFGNRINSITIGQIYDCNFEELKYNLNLLTKKGYLISKCNW